MRESRWHGGLPTVARISPLVHFRERDGRQALWVACQPKLTLIGPARLRAFALRPATFAWHRSEGWRRGRDSNPWYPSGYNGFQDRRLKPLGHLSAVIGSVTSGRLSTMPSAIAPKRSIRRALCSVVK